MWWACPRWPQADDLKAERAQALPPLMQPAAKQSHSSSQQMKKMSKRVAAGKATAEKTRQAPEAQKTVSDDTRNVTQHYSMARCHQHFRFNGVNLEQTWRDKNIFHQYAATDSPAITSLKYKKH